VSDTGRREWDESAWQALADELDLWQAAGRRATFWWRDDDAGRADPALERLLALAARAGLPVGLAVVPAWLADDAIRAIRSAPPTVLVLQHGYAHANHETRIAPGERKVRPAECGAARAADQVLGELLDGRQRLGEAFAARLLPVLVPPWNRIAPPLVSRLPPAGYRGLSTFGPRPALPRTPGLVELNCHADPILWREAKRFAGARSTLARLRGHVMDRRTGRADPVEPTGLLTHHRDMEPALWQFLETLLERLAAHPGATFPALPAALGEPWTPVAPVC